MIEDPNAYDGAAESEHAIVIAIAIGLVLLLCFLMPYCDNRAYDRYINSCSAAEAHRAAPCPSK